WFGNELRALRQETHALRYEVIVDRHNVRDEPPNDLERNGPRDRSRQAVGDRVDTLEAHRFPGIERASHRRRAGGFDANDARAAWRRPPPGGRAAASRR